MNVLYTLVNLLTFTFMHLADTFTRSDLDCILSVHAWKPIAWESNP